MKMKIWHQEVVTMQGKRSKTYMPYIYAVVIGGRGGRQACSDFRECGPG